ncbi:hypothetical protein EDE15_0518 [Edaphobacter aggregans]|uniref:Uncharacterized protein n=1 Tax=Edaphobacter aggregans TaxID=570835 RepID=A0A428MDU7_9BACT|nr:hypothetical protein EDE15_0518 [Edaphobacter aggregans]
MLVSGRHFSDSKNFGTFEAFIFERAVDISAIATFVG